ncbi:hypothetical protein JOB18_020821 [Solea senegalensis]|uniref:C-type lectin domain-containing protein n=1 Tax=Solea senegalensis TaxID=28829 RepID=A0AAV6Q283_SOLSE|nr:ladderlectin-like [Solea senegalensis]KAG7482415.1 hypothetical protein JOB18_020821 [Solea senegalensis]
MKTLTVSALVCAVVALTAATVLPAAVDKTNQTAKILLVKRSASCYGGWTSLHDRCYHYVPKPMTWARAEKHCESIGGNLASIRNIMEYHDIQSLIMKSSYEYKEAWVGGSDAQENNQWLWSDGTPFHYVNWCPGEPNNYGGKQHCLQMNHGAEKCWDDYGCNARKPSVCSKKG